MKTLTEFSALVLRNAAAARAAAGGARPQPVPAVSEAVESTGQPAEGSAEVVEASAEPATGEAAEHVEAAESEGLPEPAEAAAEAAVPATAETDPVVVAVATALSVQPDRAARLLEALDVIGGGSLDQIRLVRVYQGEKGPHNAVSRGEFHYVIDRVAGAQRSRPDDRRGGDRGGRGGGGGGGGAGGAGGRGGFGGDRKPRGLGSLKIGAAKSDKDPGDERVGRGEMPHAGIGWQLTAAPRDFSGGGKGRGGPGGPRGPGRNRGPGGGGGPGGGRGPGGGGPGGRGPSGPGGERRGNGPGPGGGPRPYEGRNPRNPNAARPAPIVEHLPPSDAAAPRLGPDGQPLPPRAKRPRKPMGPDANGMGPDGTPWDPERRGKRQAEPGPAVNADAPAAVESQPPAHSDAPSE